MTSAHAEANKRWRSKNREVVRVIQKRWYDRHKEKANADTKARRLKWFVEWETLLHELGYDRCSRCGYDTCFAALDFHHIDPKTKTALISRLFQWKPTEERIAELKKTITLCANCHRELHYSG